MIRVFNGSEAVEIDETTTDFDTLVDYVQVSGDTNVFNAIKGLVEEFGNDLDDDIIAIVVKWFKGLVTSQEACDALQDIWFDNHDFSGCHRNG